MAELARLQWQRRANRREIAEHCRAYVAEHHSPLGVSRAWCQILGLESSGPADQAPEKTSEHDYSGPTKTNSLQPLPSVVRNLSKPNRRSL